MRIKETGRTDTMRIKETGRYVNPKDVEDLFVNVLERQLDGDDYDTGAVEAAQRTATNVSRVLAELIVKLHENGCLADEDVLSFLTHKAEIVK